MSAWPRPRGLPLFHECRHGDTGAGLGAIHQTGWTARVAKLLQQSSGPARSPEYLDRI